MLSGSSNREFDVLITPNQNLFDNVDLVEDAFDWASHCLVSFVYLCSHTIILWLDNNHHICHLGQNVELG